jgi:hypothetical protein
LKHKQLALQRVISLYEAWSKPHQADAYRAELRELNAQD